MVLCPIALKKDPKGLAPAKGLADPGGPLPTPPELPPPGPSRGLGLCPTTFHPPLALTSTTAW